ncbi:Ankyrin repeat and SAM domain-containing protein 3 [Bulinus truncatus]|nr:Ankyrin repeat and SAM domain-containing protein 3 [Bulinus truncatus]
MSSELSFEASDEASENELLERSLSVWRGSCAIEWEDFTPIALDIHTACSIGHFEYVRSIILNGDGQKDRKNRGGWTPLMYASYIGHDNIVNLLIKEGCNMNMKNPRGHTPLMLAASCGNDGVARLLVRNRAQLEVSDKNGWTALFHATYAGHQNFVAFLLEVGANKDAIEPSSGMTPFMVAAAEGHEIIVQLFLQHGVNVNAKAHNGDMARTLAVLNGHMKVVSLIDSHTLPIISLRPGPSFELYAGDDAGFVRNQRSRQLYLKSQGPSIRDGPEAIARMIDRTRITDAPQYVDSHIPQGYVSFSTSDEEKEVTKLSHRDVTSPINPEDYKESSSSREFDDFNDDSNAFTKTGAITIKSSSSSSGGLIAALGLSRDGSIDSDYELTTSSSEDIMDSKLGPGQTELSPSPKDKRPSIRKEKDMVAFRTIGDEKNSYGTSHQDDTGSTSVQSCSPYNQSSDVSKRSPGNELGDLPKENMSQAEIVSRYLKNLTRNKSETHSGQYAGFEGNRWAVEEQDTISSTAQNTSVAKPSRENISLDGNKENTDSSLTADVKLCSDLRNSLTISEGAAGHVMSTGHYNVTPSKDVTQNLNYTRTHHPQLNHHHPLHNRYNHSPLSSLQDNQSSPRVGSSRMGNGHFPGPPYAFNFPQSYFYNELASAGNQSQLLNVNHLTAPGDFQPTAAVNPMSHLSGIFSENATPSSLSEQVGNNQTKSSVEQRQPSYLLSLGQQSSELLQPSQLPSAPSQVDALYCPPQATVIIPGHATSQPVSSSLSWLDEKGLNQSSPKDLNEMLSQLGLTKYLDKFEEQDVDLQVFLSLTDNDLKEIGIKLFGPRKKMTNAIARWHSSAPVASNNLEQAYADRLEGEMQEMAIQLNQAYENEEHLKAQLLQEQQLRSVTEGCLMEERSSWEQARQTLHETRNKLRTMGELLSRLRHHQKEMKKYLENPYKSNIPSADEKENKASGSTSLQDKPEAGTSGDGNCVEQERVDDAHIGPLCGQLLRKSEKCLKDMQQLFGSLVQSADRILKSTHSLSISNDLT